MILVSSYASSSQLTTLFSSTGIQRMIRSCTGTPYPMAARSSLAFTSYRSGVAFAAGSRALKKTNLRFQPDNATRCPRPASVDIVESRHRLAKTGARN